MEMGVRGLEFAESFSYVFICRYSIFFVPLETRLGLFNVIVGISTHPKNFLSSFIEIQLTYKHLCKFKVTMR